MISGVSLWLAFVATSALAWTSTPFSPASVPLAVRTPYLSAWLAQGTGTALNNAWPTFWTGTNLGWAGFIRVDGTSYSYLGAASVPDATYVQAEQLSLEFTATQSVFVFSAGGVNITVSFLSPVEPNDFVKHSTPFSYMALSVQSTDGAAHSVQLYSDISAEWVTGDNSLTANWTTTTGDIYTYQVQLEDQTVFGEISDHIQQGSAYYSTASVDGITYQTGEDTVVRAQFLNNGVLENSEDTDFRAVEDDWPVFAFAHDLGDVTESSEPIVVSVGLLRDPVVEYIIANDAIQDRSLYLWSEYSSSQEIIAAFLSDYSDALTRAEALDAQLYADASAISSDYAAVCALSVRQAFAATEMTISRADDGSWNTSDILVFLKEISSDGNVNTVDVIFPAWPLFLYFNAEIGEYLLEPLFLYQETGQWPEEYSIHDLGSTYPQALGHNDGDDEAMPIEECGNMVIMTLSVVQALGDTAWADRHYKLLDQWTQFLIADSLIPGDQLSTDDFAGALANQTNLAIKGIVGIGAMAEIARLLGNEDTASNYSSIAQSYVSQWQVFATSDNGEHLTLSYGNSSSWGLSYNLYADKLLNLSLFPSSVYEMQTSWYSTVEGLSKSMFSSLYKQYWQSLTSAIVTDDSVRDFFISSVAKYASDGLNSVPLSDWYDAISGISDGFEARPVVGGHLAHVSVPIRTEYFTRLIDRVFSCSLFFNHTSIIKLGC
ncbi:DUF1793-domain-containing protein [Fistulina hepatica ATCC 64428]|uniref:DUF1793-domain-containing protein n=1 Tax=Fistulina hepatica ATCC 64428 TaxID=1128425 RepID=A0A0D7A6L8_9AGAR|nr:DUF1793-domain-containing protein [Fistulina hepatica ATCC 64428]